MPRREARTYPGLYLTQYFYKREDAKTCEEFLKVQREALQGDRHSLTHMLILDQCVQLRLVRHAEDHSHAAVLDHVAGVLHLLGRTRGRCTDVWLNEWVESDTKTPKQRGALLGVASMRSIRTGEPTSPMAP